jgi:TRAP transporter TAXI family solute receptor
MKTLRTAALAAAATFAFGSAVHAEEASYVLATASTGGTYYPVGVALSTLVKVKLEPGEKIGMSAISSAGSGENIRLMRENEAQFAILQGLFGSYAATGTGPIADSGPQPNVRSVTMLWQNVEQFIVSKDSAGDGTVGVLADLKGKSMAMGAQNSGTIGSNAAILEGLGINLEADYELVYGGFGPAVEALQNGQVVGVGIGAGVPTGAVSQLMASAGDSVMPLEVTDEQMAAMDAGRNLWTRFVIAAGTYPGQEADWNTVAQPNFLAANADVSEDNVYQITKTIYENLPFLQAIHPATKAMALEAAIVGLPVPLHPGAAKYYQEQGITIPDHLIAN